MKKIFVLATFALLTAGAFAGTAAVNEKVLKAFHETFTSAQQVSWYENEDNYSVRFVQKDIKYIVYYDKGGSIINSMRFYQPALLPANILSELTKRYSSKTAFGVTEITSGSDVVYFVRMEDKKYWYTIKFNEYGESELNEKLKKQQ